VTRAHIRKIASDGDGAAGTDWSRYNLDQIWHMVNTEDGRVTYTQIDAWRRMTKLCQEQADQLERAIIQLLQRWPAQPGSASEAFSDLVTALIASMREAAEAAARNPEPLANITNILTGARVEIRALLEAWRQYSLTEQQLTPQPTPSPGQIPVPAAPGGLQPPPENWRSQLEQQARAIMAHTDTNVGAEATRIQAPPPYAFRPIIDTDGPSPGVKSDSGGSVGAGGVAVPVFDLADRMAPVNVAVPSYTGGTINNGDSDPILSGSAFSGTPATGVFGDTGGIGGVASGGSTSGSFVTTPYGDVLAPGGTIGARASTPATQATSRTPTGAGATNGVAGRAGAQGAMPMAPMVPPTGSRPRVGTSGLSAAGRLGRGGRRNRSHADPNDPWAVAEGGPTVLEPVPEPTEHDPGPGVIGLDR
jgi:hypothetical protein